ncbi:MULTISPECIES: M42 family metallopeptidase [unclassified Mycoplasma]|uniref:M42 family metallopeptidase n=1 Tax=unclassified Mycoplasma TaxID=2683645 RepID=UPI00211C9476|nr:MULTISPECIES: M42 family metallopeptidase [unclassified Mycoplasma]UUM20094.1 M42 family metallopeptidase [Mycoplasma sp. 1578d]UUM25074.1 M42 family metallopeptidase [Mycoplasma sp. 3686d]
MNKEQFKQRLIQYMELEAMSRFEEPVVNALKQNVNSSVFEFTRDNFGSLIMHKKSKNPNAPKVMIAAHMDEIGYLVREIDKQGQLLLSPVGGIWPSVVIGTKAKLINSLNEEFLGVFGHTSIHILEPEKVSKAITNNEIYADFGFKNRQEALENNVQVGDRVYISGETVLFKNEDLIGGKAMDNRAGVTVLDYVASQVANLDLDVDLYLVGTVQEEVGTRGAKTSVSLINPQVAIALDTTSSHDTIGTISGTTRLFAGAALRIKDGGTLMDPKLVQFVYNTAQKYSIPAYKFVAMGGGTDAHELQYARGGAATLTISLPQRYLHSPIGVCSISDLMAAGNLLVKFLQDFSQQEYIKMEYK